MSFPPIRTHTHTYHFNHNRFWSSCFKHYPKRLGSLYQSTFVCEGEEQGEAGRGAGRSREGRGRGNKDEQKEKGPLFI